MYIFRCYNYYYSRYATVSNPINNYDALINEGYGFPSPTKISSKIYSIALMIFGVYGIVGILHAIIQSKVGSLRTTIRQQWDAASPAFPVPVKSDSMRSRISSHFVKTISESQKRLHLMPNKWKYKLLMLRSIFGIFMCLLVCALFFKYTQGWSNLDAVYFAVQTLTVRRPVRFDSFE